MEKKKVKPKSKPQIEIEAPQIPTPEVLAELEKAYQEKQKAKQQKDKK